ncbi:hypothetical protein GCM10010517_69850 [Streptosporangium fragile]|uniref:Secreted protein n=1 Tax=Streptosporangium fragile TaxID=46186 RepID=A0ABP6IQ94_9ACTN
MKKPSIPRRGSTAATMLAAAMLAAAVLPTGGTASAAAPDITAGGRARTAAEKCGLYKDGTSGVYRNCDHRSELIFVTKPWSANEFHCVPANARKNVGFWYNIYGVYHQSWGC